MEVQQMNGVRNRVGYTVESLAIANLNLTNYLLDILT